MSQELWADNTTGTLAAGVAQGATTLSYTVTSGTFPTPGTNQVFHLIINGGQPGNQATNTEIAEVIGNASGVFTLAAGTQYSHAAGEPVAAIVTAAGLSSLLFELASISGPGLTTEGDALYTINSSGDERVILDDGDGYMGIPAQGGLIVGINNPTEPLTSDGVSSEAGLQVYGGDVIFGGLSYAQSGVLTITPAVTGSTSYTYSMVLEDRNGNSTPLLLTQTITNGPATLSNTDYIQVETPPLCPGALTVSLIRDKNTLVDSVPVNYQTDTVTFVDSGGGTAYTPFTQDHTMMIYQFGTVIPGVQNITANNEVIYAPLALLPNDAGIIPSNGITLNLPTNPIIGATYSIAITAASTNIIIAPVIISTDSGYPMYQFPSNPGAGATFTWLGNTWAVSQLPSPVPPAETASTDYPTWVALGSGASVNAVVGDGYSTAIGYNAQAATGSTAIGAAAQATYGNDVAIGANAATQHANQIMLGGIVAANYGLEFPRAQYVDTSGITLNIWSPVAFLYPPSGSTVTMPTLHMGQLMWLVNTSQYPITVDMASGQTVMPYPNVTAASSFTLPGYTTYCVYLPPSSPTGSGSSGVAIVISNNLPLPTAPGTEFLTTTLSVPATTATEITSATLSPGIYDLQGIVSWEAGTIAAEVGAWFELGTAVGTLTTTTDTSTTNTLGAGEACTKPVGSVTITTEGTVLLMGEASAAMTVTNTAIYGPANTATGMIIRQIAPGLG